MVNETESPQDSRYENFLLQTVDYLDGKINAGKLSKATRKEYHAAREVIFGCAASYTLIKVIDESPELEEIIDRLDVGEEVVMRGLTVSLSKSEERKRD